MMKSRQEKIIRKEILELEEWFSENYFDTKTQEYEFNTKLEKLKKDLHSVLSEPLINRLYALDDEIGEAVAATLADGADRVQGYAAFQALKDEEQGVKRLLGAEKVRYMRQWVRRPE